MDTLLQDLRYALRTFARTPALRADDVYSGRDSNAVVLLAAALTPVLVAAAASYLPARRAAQVDPTVALRYE